MLQLLGCLRMQSICSPKRLWLSPWRKQRSAACLATPASGSHQSAWGESRRDFCSDERLSAKIMFPLKKKVKPKMEARMPNQTVSSLCLAGKLDALRKLDVPHLFLEVLWRHSSAGGCVSARQNDTSARSKLALTGALTGNKMTNPQVMYKGSQMGSD